MANLETSNWEKRESFAKSDNITSRLHRRGGTPKRGAEKFDFEPWLQASRFGSHSVER